MLKSAFSIELGTAIEKAEKSQDFGAILDTLITHTAMFIVRNARGDPELLNKLLEGSSAHLFDRASLFNAGIKSEARDEPGN